MNFKAPPLPPEVRIAPGQGQVVAVVAMGTGPLLLTRRDTAQVLKCLKQDAEAQVFTLELTQRSQSMDDPISKLELGTGEDGARLLMLSSVVWREGWEDNRGYNDSRVVDITAWPADEMPALTARLEALLAGTAGM